MIGFRFSIPEWNAILSDAAFFGGAPHQEACDIQLFLTTDVILITWS